MVIDVDNCVDNVLPFFAHCRDTLTFSCLYDWMQNVGLDIFGLWAYYCTAKMHIKQHGVLYV